jgi:hypothetical protein
MSSQHFEWPIHQDTLFEIMRNFYRNTKNVDVYMKDLDIRTVIEELQHMYTNDWRRKALTASERALGTKLVLVIEDIDRHRVHELACEYENDKPVTAPPDASTFQISRANSNSVISKDEREKVDKLLKIPSLFDQSLQLRSK